MWSLNAGFFTVCLWALASLNVSGLIHSDESGFTERGWGDHASFNNMRRAGQMPELSYWGLHLDHPVLKVNHAAMKKIRELKMCDNGWGIMVCFKWDIHFIAGFQFRISFHFRSFIVPIVFVYRTHESLSKNKMRSLIEVLMLTVKRCMSISVCNMLLPYIFRSM